MNVKVDYYMGFERRGFYNIILIVVSFFVGSFMQGMFFYGFS
jgi:hypothetical protein